MTEKKKPVRRSMRGKGRPSATEHGVGRDALIDATRRMLQDRSASRITTSSIAKAAGADPALIRYYFGTRAALLLETITILVREESIPPGKDAGPLARFAYTISKTFDLTRVTRDMHRLIVEDLSEKGSDESRKLLRDINSARVDDYAALAAEDGNETFARFDPLFMYLTILGIADFFNSAQEIIRDLVPVDTDMIDLGRRYEEFVTELIFNGVLRR